MLAELSVTDLGVIEHLRLLLASPGMTAVTGETGAGKTMVVGAIDLLVGGRADPQMVRRGASEAVVEGRFIDGDDELILTRVVPSSGRSRAYVNGRLATASALAEHGARLVDLHGQHAHQSLLSMAVQRSALDRFAAIDLSPLAAAARALRDIEAALGEFGGDERQRAREMDLLRFQADEIDSAAICGPDEDEQLEAEEDLLADAVSHQEAARGARERLVGDRGAEDLLGDAVESLAGRLPFAELEVRARSVMAELAELSADIRAAEERIEPDPERLANVTARRKVLRDLCRKFGDDLAAVLAYRAELGAQLDDLETHDDRARLLDEQRVAAKQALDAAAAEVGAARRAAAPGLAQATEAHLRDLAMPKATMNVAVGDADPGDDVTFLFAANPGSAPAPLSKVASGGELARTMLGIRLVLSESPPTLVFDEVDAGIGGSAALAVGRALARLGSQHQVLVVTHLPQVAAFADAQVEVSKTDDGERTVSAARTLADDERVVELSRMLSGSPDSATARDHAHELLTEAERARHEDR